MIFNKKKGKKEKGQGIPTQPPLFAGCIQYEWTRSTLRVERVLQIRLGVLGRARLSHVQRISLQLHRFALQYLLDTSMRACIS